MQNTFSRLHLSHAGKVNLLFREFILELPFVQTRLSHVGENGKSSPFWTDTRLLFLEACQPAGILWVKEREGIFLVMAVHEN